MKEDKFKYKLSQEEITEDTLRLIDFFKQVPSELKVSTAQTIICTVALLASHESPLGRELGVTIIEQANLTFKEVMNEDKK